ncbi:hypothetical protein protein [Bacillus cereus G9241]|nr:hypothetical protein protein [Bacillus cereus G9241]EAL13181.1 hypothetical protein protein [Bacillus cereus G9241]EAL14328.1 hypothetical protein protein [Bacillus cereus G9241]
MKEAASYNKMLLFSNFPNIFYQLAPFFVSQ